MGAIELGPCYFCAERKGCSITHRWLYEVQNSPWPTAFGAEIGPYAVPYETGDAHENTPETESPGKVRPVIQHMDPAVVQVNNKANLFTSPTLPPSERSGSHFAIAASEAVQPERRTRIPESSPDHSSDQSQTLAQPLEVGPSLSAVNGLSSHTPSKQTSQSLAHSDPHMSPLYAPDAPRSPLHLLNTVRDESSHVIASRDTNTLGISQLAHRSKDEHPDMRMLRAIMTEEEAEALRDRCTDLEQLAVTHQRKRKEAEAALALSQSSLEKERAKLSALQGRMQELGIPYQSTGSEPGTQSTSFSNTTRGMSQHGQHLVRDRQAPDPDSKARKARKDQDLSVERTSPVLSATEPVRPLERKRQNDRSRSPIRDRRSDTRDSYPLTPHTDSGR